MLSALAGAGSAANRLFLDLVLTDAGAFLGSVTSGEVVGASGPLDELSKRWLDTALGRLAGLGEKVMLGSEAELRLRARVLLPSRLPCWPEVPATSKSGSGIECEPTDRERLFLPVSVWSIGWAAAVFLCERRSDPPGLELGRLDIGTSLLKGHTLSRHYHSQPCANAPTSSLFVPVL